MRVPATVLLATVCLLFALMLGCGVMNGATTGTGESKDILYFLYTDVAGEADVPTDGALATGTWVTAEVWDISIVAKESSQSSGYETHHRNADGYVPDLEITDVYSEDPETLEIRNLDEPDEFELIAHEPSSGTDIELEVDSADFALTETIRTAEAESVEFRPSCETADYLTDATARFVQQVYDEDGDLLTGRGLYAAGVEPSEGGTVDDDPAEAGSLTVDTGSDPGDYHLEPELDGDALGFSLIDPGEVDNFEFVEKEHGEATVFRVGESLSAGRLTAESDNGVVCGPASEFVEVTTETPDVCELALDGFGDDHSLVVTGLHQGDCNIELSALETDWTESLTVGIN